MFDTISDSEVEMAIGFYRRDSIEYAMAREIKSLREKNRRMNEYIDALYELRDAANG